MAMEESSIMVKEYTTIKAFCVMLHPDGIYRERWEKLFQHKIPELGLWMLADENDTLLYWKSIDEIDKWLADRGYQSREGLMLFCTELNELMPSEFLLPSSISKN